MRYILSLCFVLLLPSLAQWVMFADSKDTYLYNTQTGEIYIRYKKKGKNYEDIFVKMPRGMNAEEIDLLSNKNNPETSLQDEANERKLQSLKKSQKMINDVFEESF